LALSGFSYIKITPLGISFFKKKKKRERMGGIINTYNHQEDRLYGILDVNKSSLGFTTINKLELLTTKKSLRPSKNGTSQSKNTKI
jgi:hypothetical protein